MKRKKQSVVLAKSGAPRTGGLKLPLAAPRKAPKPGKCVICGGVAAPFSSEDLCWVCRRLKISAWRESENQPAIQE